MMRPFLLALVLALPLGTSVTYAQGCSQCRDNAAATPPQTQAAYRHAIMLLVIAAGSVFTAAVVVLKRSR